MEQQFIRAYNSTTYTVEEGAALIAELDKRTRSSQDGYNSVDELATRLKELLLSLAAKKVLINGQPFDYRPIKGNDGSSFQVGDIALNGWVEQNKFGKILSYNGGDATQISGWDIIEYI